MVRLGLILIGCIATALAIAGAILPGLPTTPFLLVALWAFARSSEWLYAKIQAIPILQTALKESRRFEEKRAMRLTVKLTAVIMAWSSFLLTYWTTGGTANAIVLTVMAAAIAGTIAVILIPTDNS